MSARIDSLMDDPVAPPTVSTTYFPQPDRRLTLTTSDDGLADNNGTVESNLMVAGGPRASRVTFSGSADMDDIVEETKREMLQHDGAPAAEREGWDNKLQFMLGVTSYAVGLGNVWRFPYLCQQNGGGAFLIPYCIMMLLEGAPLFLIEMGIGQRLRVGPIGVWNHIHPYLGGVGVSSAVVSFLVGLYYNVIITWCLYYLGHSFRAPLPWKSCPLVNGTPVDECTHSSETAYFWYRNAIGTTESIEDLGGINWPMFFCLVAAWFIVWICVMKGIKTSGKVMYLTATFPYLVTTIFLVRAVTLPGASAGIVYMFTPNMRRLFDPRVWLDAATQIFYSMGLAFGGLIAFSSYNPPKNNVKRDVIVLSIANLVTSLYTGFVIFCILGYKGQLNFNKCVGENIKLLHTYYPERFPIDQDIKMSVESFQAYQRDNFEYSTFPNLSGHTHKCDFDEIIKDAAEGTGLAFIVFTQAMLTFPAAPFWAILFFLMLLMLGLGSMFGTLEGVITSIHDLRLFPWLSKPVLTGILCGFSCMVGTIFVTHAGEYYVKLFDAFAGSYALMAVAFFEVIAVVYVYGWERFARDIEWMTGEKVGRYWLWTWRFIAPSIMAALFVSSLVVTMLKTPKYHAYNVTLAKPAPTPYPVWCMFIAGFLVFAAMVPVPFVFFIRKYKIWQGEPDVPTAERHLNSSISTQRMLRSVASFNSTETEMDQVVDNLADKSNGPVAVAVPNNK